MQKGMPTVAIGIYLKVYYALQLDDDILLLAKEDEMGKALQDLSLEKREKASKKEKGMKDYIFVDFDWLKEPRLIGELSYESPIIWF